MTIMMITALLMMTMIMVMITIDGEMTMIIMMMMMMMMTDLLMMTIIMVMITIRSEEHTSELQSRQYLVCRLLLEKKNKLERTVTLREGALRIENSEAHGVQRVLDGPPLGERR